MTDTPKLSIVTPVFHLKSIQQRADRDIKDYMSLLHAFAIVTASIVIKSTDFVMSKYDLSLPTRC